MIFRMVKTDISAAKQKKSGFTLVEVVVACALLGLLVVASFIAVTSVTHASRLMSQRVTAQGMCTALLENMKNVPYDCLPAQGTADASNYDDIYVGIKASDIVSKGLGPGSQNVTLTYEIESGEGAPNRKNVKITCAWEFTDHAWFVDHGNGIHHEILEAVLTDRYSTSTESMVLNVTGFKLNPNCNLSPDHRSYTLPSKLRIVDTDGKVWTQKDLESGGMSSISARSVEIFPGGGGIQEGLYTSFPKLTVNNSKTYAYYSKDDSTPISVSISSKDRNGIYTMSMNCDDASVNIE